MTDTTRSQFERKGLFIMTNKTNIRLTASEIAALWVQYQNNTLVSCVFKYLISNNGDNSIREILKFAITLSQEHLRFVRDIFPREDFAIPIGFTDSDVNINAENLFGDCFALHYLDNMSRLAVAAYGLALCNATRSDIRDFYKQAVIDAMKINEKAVQLMLEKGIYNRPPSIPPSKTVQFAKKQGFLGSLLTEMRPLTSVEIMNLFNNIQTNIMGKAMMTAFSQVATSPEFRDYFLRGKEIARKHIDIFSEKLSQDDLNGCLPIEPLITSSTQAPFSDKLMMFHTTALVQAGIGNYGLSISTIQRYDLAIDYARLMTEIGVFAKDGANIMIDKGWFEEPPQAVNRKELAMSHH